MNKAQQIAMDSIARNELDHHQRAVYGYCPECGKPGRSRERRINGNDVCYGWHTYPSAMSLNAVQLAMKVAAAAKANASNVASVNAQVESLGLMPFVITTMG